MDAGDASPAEMRRPPANRDADLLALDEDTVEELLTGALLPWNVPAGYTKVAQLLAAAAAAPTPEELVGQGAVVTEFRAMARARSAAALAPGGRATARRRRRGLAVAIVVGALATGGVAGAATGHLPGPVRDAARAITGTGIETPASRTTGPPSASATGTPAAGGTGAKVSGPGAALGSAPASTGAGPAPGPALEGLCKAFAAGNGAERGGKPDAAVFKELITAAGGEKQVPAYCEDLLPGDQQLKKTKPPELPVPSGTGGQGQGGGRPPVSTGGTGGQGGSAPEDKPAP
jgi:hypothetical protein